MLDSITNIKAQHKEEIMSDYNEMAKNTTSMKEYFKKLVALNNVREIKAILDLLPEEKKEEYRAIMREENSKR